jgi:hypothetical protein
MKKIILFSLSSFLLFSCINDNRSEITNSSSEIFIDDFMYEKSFNHINGEISGVASNKLYIQISKTIFNEDLRDENGYITMIEHLNYLNVIDETIGNLNNLTLFLNEDLATKVNLKAYFGGQVVHSSLKEKTTITFAMFDELENETEDTKYKICENHICSFLKYKDNTALVESAIITFNHNMAKELTYQQLFKITTHEIGHILGLKDLGYSSEESILSQEFKSNSIMHYENSLISMQNNFTEYDKKNLSWRYETYPNVRGL